MPTTALPDSVPSISVAQFVLHGMQDDVPSMNCAGKPGEHPQKYVDAAVCAAAAPSDPDWEGWEEDGDEEEEDVAAAYHHSDKSFQGPWRASIY